MRSLTTIFLLFWVIAGVAQKALTFREVLKTAKEISIADSLLIHYYSGERIPLDHSTGESFFKTISRNEALSFQNAVFFAAGKITSHKDFDILLFCVEKSITTTFLESVDPDPINGNQIKDLFFVLLDKEGTYKNNFLAAREYRIKDFDKNITRKISSRVYPDLRIIQQTVTDHWPSYLIYLPFTKNSTKEYNSSMEYRINEYGVFVAYPKYKSN